MHGYVQSLQMQRVNAQNCASLRMYIPFCAGIKIAHSHTKAPQQEIANELHILNNTVYLYRIYPNASMSFTTLRSIESTGWCENATRKR